MPEGVTQTRPRAASLEGAQRPGGGHARGGSSPSDRSGHPSEVGTHARRPEPILSVSNGRYAIEVNESGLWIDRADAANEGGFIVIPLAEIESFGEVVDRAYKAGKEAGLWA